MGEAETHSISCYFETAMDPQLGQHYSARHSAFTLRQDQPGRHGCWRLVLTRGVIIIIPRLGSNDYNQPLDFKSYGAIFIDYNHWP